MSVAQHALIENPRTMITARLGQTGGRFLGRRQILDAAEACLAESGYDGATIRAIAGRLGCAVGSMYRHFTDKRELLLAAGERLMQPVVDQLALGESLESSIARYIRAARQRQELYRLQFWLMARGPGGPVPPCIAAIIDGWAARLGERAEAERRWAMIHGLLMLGQDAEEILPHVAAAAASPTAAPTRVSWQSNQDEDVTLL